jgi:hypothetical protein
LGVFQRFPHHTPLLPSVSPSVCRSYPSGVRLVCSSRTRSPLTAPYSSRLQANEWCHQLRDLPLPLPLLLKIVPLPGAPRQDLGHGVGRVSRRDRTGHRTELDHLPFAGGPLFAKVGEAHVMAVPGNVPGTCCCLYGAFGLEK